MVARQKRSRRQSCARSGIEMKTLSEKQLSRRGFSLLECVVYLAVLAIVTGLAFAAYQRCLAGCASFQRNADDIARALEAGERWREDVRQSGQISVSENSLQLHQHTNTIEYTFHDSAIWRRIDNG